PPKLHTLLPNSFDIIGTIVIIDLNRENLIPLRPYLMDIGNYLIKSNPSIKTVFEKAGNIEGVFRTRQLNFVCGVDDPITTYKENGCRFQLNIRKIFFSPRLSYERNRIAVLNTEFNQRGALWDMFCGVGPYFIQIAKKNPNMEMFATDINPIAIKYAQKNIRLNKITENIICFSQDVTQIHNSPYYSKMFHKISRLIMNLPEKNLDFLSILPDFLHPKGCLIHIYQFSEKNNPFEDSKKKFLSALVKADLKLDQLLNQRIVKPFSPALDTTVIDAIISSIN
ncbi:MAG: class I SAM-dependent methyltransferase, partial [Promethearchaeota archaeon]